MKTYKFCFWNTCWTHHFGPFCRTLAKQAEVDVQVRFFQRLQPERRKEGWEQGTFEPFEQEIAFSRIPQELLSSVPDWKERIHIISKPTAPELVDFFCNNHVLWCHWSEPFGIRLFQLCRQNLMLFRLLEPLLWLKRRTYGRQIRDYALGAWSQGYLARRSFIHCGVPESKIVDLYYATEAIPEATPIPALKAQIGERKVFLAVNSLSYLKGIDLLIHAMAELKNEKWCLVLCGVDMEAGKFQRLAKRLRIESQVIFTGAWPSSSIASVYAVADVFILASRFDGWGAVLNEAASAGLPLIATDMCSAAWHVINDNQNGFRIKAGNLKALRQAMQFYCDSPEYATIHGLESRRLYEKELTPEVWCQRFLTGIEKMKKYN